MFHVIDDDDRICKLLKALVIKAGYEATCFETAEKYIEYMNSNSFQKPVAVLSDVVMPGINGYELATLIRKKLPSQKIILVSATPSEGYNQFANDQLCALINKPFHPLDMISKIKALASCDEIHASGEYIYGSLCDFGMNCRCPFYNLIK